MARLLVVSACLLVMVLAEDCQFPIQLPVITRLEVNGGARPPSPIVNITLVSEHPFVMTSFTTYHRNSAGRLVHSTVDRISSQQGLAEENAGSRMEESVNGDQHLILLYNNTVLDHIYLKIVFDIGCTRMLTNLNLNLKGREILRNYDPGQIVESPQPDMIAETNKTYQLKFKLKTETDLDAFPRLDFYRDTSGLFISHPGENKIPFATERRTDESKNTIKETVVNTRLSDELRDVIIAVRMKQYNFHSRSPPLKSIYIGYKVDLHVDDETMETNYIVESCSNRIDPEPRREGDILRVIVRAGGPVCIRVTLSGYPLPDVSLAETSPDGNVVRLLPADFPGKYGARYDRELYFLGNLRVGEPMFFVLLLNGTNGQERQKIVVEAHK